MATKKLRSATTDYLSSIVNKVTAAKYENAIYDMSVRTGTPYSSLAYEKVGQLLNASTKSERLEILKDMNVDVEGYDSCVYKRYYDNYVEKLNKVQEKPKAVKGMYKCKVKGCDSDEFYVWQQQTRGGDEGMTTFRQCQKCGKRGRE